MVIHPGADTLNIPYALMAHDPTRLGAPVDTMVDVEIGAADSGRGEPDDGVCLVDYGWLRPGLDGHVVGVAVPDHG